MPHPNKIMYNRIGRSMVADGNSPYSLFNIESNIILKSEKEKGDNVNVCGLRRTARIESLWIVVTWPNGVRRLELTLS